MHYKKIILGLVLFPALTSCGSNSYVGEYVFQMGKNKDTHMAVSLKLNKENYDEAAPEKGQSFSLEFDVSTPDVENEFSSILESVTPLTGYYEIDKENKIYNESRLNIGINLFGEYEVPQTLTDLLFLASINKTCVTFYLPVSMEDLTLQLYWYGYDISGSNIAESIAGGESEGADPIDSPDGSHPLGTLPTEEDIAKINEHYPDNHDGKSFRAFHVLKLGLTKK